MLKYITFIILFIAGSVAFAQTDGIQQNSEQEEEENLMSPEAPAMVFPLHDVELPLEKEQRDITDLQWQRMTNDPAFAYDDPDKEDENIGEGPGIWSRIILAIAEFFASGAGMILLWVLLGLALVYIIFRMVKMKGNLFFARKDKKMANDADVYADEYVPEDWQQAIQEAADNGNYRLAVRHTYRYLLHLLSEKGKISYQTAKTNYQYAYELAGTGLYQPFLHMTRQYEYAWYGGFDLQRQQFDHYYSLLKNIQSGLGRL